jgi:hypothetical protein
MKSARHLPLLLALFVQGRAWFQPVLALGRVVPPLAVQLCRWLGLGMVVSGAAHAQSAGSATISGVVVYADKTPVGDPTNHVAGKVGTAAKFRITVLNPGSDIKQNTFDCRPLPPGMTIDTNAGAAGYILGTPTQAGTYHVSVFAGNLNYGPVMLSMPVTIDIAPNGVAPVIATNPLPQTVAVGGTARFDVVATGDPAPTYQWWVGDLPVPNATLPTLVLGNVPATADGLYRVRVSNAAGSVTSAPVRLAVTPFDVPLRLVQSSVSSNIFFFVVTGPQVGTYTIWKSRDAMAWTAIATQRVTTGTWSFATNCVVDAGFFRATAVP